MMRRSSARTSTFEAVFPKELEVINTRRKAVAEGKLAGDRGHPPDTEINLTEADLAGIRVEVEQLAADGNGKDERGQKIPVPRKGHKLTGLALSGGGIRSASFCLGVLQGIDAVREDKDPQILDRIDYLSTVSGGGYIGTSLVTGLMQTKGRFPFASKLDQAETIETQHLRDHSNFLFPKGSVDVLVALITVLRGIVINGIVFLGAILFAAALTIYINPDPRDLIWVPGNFGLFTWTLIALGIFLAVQVCYAIFDSHLPPRKRTLEFREKTARWLMWLPIAVVLFGFVEAQAYVIHLVLAAYGNAAQAADAGQSADPGILGTTLTRIWTALVAVGTILTAFSGKLMKVVKATIGDLSWSGSIKRWASKAALYVVALVIPLLLWGSYIMFSAWGIRANETNGGTVEGVGLPTWYVWLLSWFPGEASALRLYLAVGLAAVFVSIWVKPNAGSLHGLYRDSLSRAFLWQRDKLRKEGRKQQDNGAATDSEPLSLKIERQRKWIEDVRAGREKPMDVDKFRFSSLKPRKGAGWSDAVRFSPYLIVNTAVNLESSAYLNRRGRNADSFIFSPLFTGSEATGYARTRSLELVDPNVNLGTAMAASGAAASANMGDQTIKALTFSMSVLNIRLGYWVPNPRYVYNWKGPLALIANLGPFYYALETLGQLDEQRNNVYLTDGGHFDNLGLYELLKRRCRFIIAVDAEADPAMTFSSFIRIQRHARIDLGVKIDLPWETLRRRSLSVGKGTWERPVDPAAHRGPHVAVGRIDYGDLGTGVIIYIKSSLSGDESDLIADYKRRYTDFPHETTLDQFFSEEQFEVYRALGFHAAKGFLSGNDDFASFLSNRPKDWLADLEEAVEHLNLPEDARRKIMARVSGPEEREGQVRQDIRLDRKPDAPPPHGPEPRKVPTPRTRKGTPGVTT